jgi:sterol 14-demethylase
MMRMAKEDVVVPGSLSDIGASFIIPKGYLVMASPLVSQMDPQIWLSADKWEPSRWMNPDGITAGWSRDDGEKVDYGFGPVSKGTGSPYQPFGAGRHRCIGEQVSHLLS